MRIHICGGEYGRFLNLCAGNGICMWNLQCAPKGYEADIYAADFLKLAPYCRKCRTRVRIRQKYGLPFFVKRHRKRKAFLLGIVFCGFFIFLLSGFIWNVSIEGNRSITRQTFLEYLNAQSVAYGTRKSAIDCKALAADIRNQFPEVIWVSVKMEGTGLFINVQENTDTQLYDNREYADSDLVAEADGVIEKIITRRGTPLVAAGDEVHEGDILVSARSEITNDAGEVAAVKYCAADADIYIRTQLTYRHTFPLAYESAEYTGRKRMGFYVKAFGRYFGVDTGVQSFETADKLTREYQLHILRDFYLPLSAGVVSVQEWKNTVKMYTQKEAIAIAETRLQKFLSEKEEKGVQIFENNVKIDISATMCRAEGTLTAVQKTGRRVRTERENLPQEGTD